MFEIMLIAFLETVADVEKMKRKKCPYEEERKKLEKERKKKELGFSTDIGDTQDFCFNQGIAGYCNENCECYMKKCCELL